MKRPMHLNRQIMLRDWTFEITSIYDPPPVVGLTESEIKILMPEIS